MTSMQIQHFVDADFMANWVRMGLTGSNRIYVFFEGESDFRLFRQFFDESQCCLFPHPAGARGPGRAEVVRTMEQLRGVDRVMAIVDADFWHVTGRKPLLPNLFITDTHDTETLVIRSSAFDKTLDNYCDLGKLRGFLDHLSAKHLRSVLLVSAEGIGYLRLANETERLGLPFSRIDLAQFVNPTSLAVDCGALVDAIGDAHKGRHVRKNALLQSIENGRRAGHDPWHIVCGHDIVKVLSVGLRDSFGCGEGHDPEELERGLRQAFAREHFRRTKLYKEIQYWSRVTLGRKILC